MIKYCLQILLASLFPAALFSQNSHILVLDASNGKPVPYASVCLEAMDKSSRSYNITDQNGLIANTITKPAEIAVSFIGYKTLIDTIHPGLNYTFKLKPSTFEINEVVVTGQFTPQTVDKSIYKVQVINSMQIQNKAANNLNDLLSGELGISTRSGGILGSTIQMQGLSGEHIKILIDGVPVIGRQNGNVDLSQLNLNNLDHVEVIEGPMSVIYGSNALAGAINLITKSNTRLNFIVEVNSYFESVGMYNAGASLTKKIGNHNFNFNFGRNFFDGYAVERNIKVDSTDYSFNPKEQYFSNFDYSFNFNKITLKFSQEYFNETLKNYGNIFLSRVNDSIAHYSTNDETHKTIRSNSKLNLKYTLSEKSYFDCIGAYSLYRKSKITYANDLYYLTQVISTDPALHDTTSFDAYVLRANYARFWSKIELQSGLDCNLEQGRGKRIVNTKSIGEYAAFTSIKYSPSGILTVQGGARLIYNTKYEAPIVYALNLKWDPIEKLNIRISYGKGFRTPSLKELYLNFVDVNHNVKGNPNLQAELSKNINFSVNYITELEKQSFEYSLKLYDNRISNKIDLLIESDQAYYMNINGIYRTHGGQLDITYKLHPRFSLTAGVNYYGNSKIVDLNQYTYTRDFTSSFNYSNLKYLFKINLFYKYNGRVSQYYANPKDETQIIENYVDAYQMFDLTISRPFFSDQLKVSCGVKNLLNYKSVKSQGSMGQPHGGDGEGSQAVGWGRSYLIKLTYQFSKY